MKAKKLMTVLLGIAMTISMAGCGNNTTSTSTGNEPQQETEVTAPEPEQEPEVVPEVKEVSVDFEDGAFGFVQAYTKPGDSDTTEISVADFNGSKALKIASVDGNIPYVGIDVVSMAGTEIANVAKIEMTLAIENPDGKFYACSGNVLTWTGADAKERKHDWSVYLEDKNPKVANIELEVENGEKFDPEGGNIMIISLDTDNGKTAGAAAANLYVDDIRLLDADGNVIKADSSVAFSAPRGFEVVPKDMSNLKYLKNAVEFEGFTVKEGSFAQNGLNFTQEFVDALVPGSIVEIEFESTTGDMWIVLPDAAVGWSRVERETAATNNSKNICQITYEQMVAVVGEGEFTTDKRLQCESSGDWQVYSVRVGIDSGLQALEYTAEFEGFTCAAGAYAQAGFKFTQPVLDALVPGSVIEIAYTSELNDMWLVLPDAKIGWTRVQRDTAAMDGSICQITYEQMIEAAGEGEFTLDKRLQCESSGAWTVYSIKIGMPLAAAQETE